jgi:hypothetical protein
MGSFKESDVMKLESSEVRKYASPQAHIDDLNKRKNKNDENSTSLTHDIELQIETALKGEQKIFFELIQNADDTRATQISMQIIGSYLLIMHDGQDFSESDVEKICDIAQQRYQDKSNEQGKTGYKGIGFKAIFSVADRVHIVSGDGDCHYSFRFDKNHFVGSRTPSAAYPWPIIPIWTTFEDCSDNPRQVLAQVQENIGKTFIIAKLKAVAQVALANDLKLMREDPKPILFLRSIKEIHLVENEVKFSIKKAGSDVSVKDGIDLYVNRSGWPSWQLLSTWLAFEYILSESELEEANKAIAHANLSNYECPQRIKDAKSTTITFALQIKNDRVVPVVSPLFSYLPTRVHCGFPLVVNADFLLNAERTQLTENPWNDMLMYRIAYGSFLLMQKIAAMPRFRSQVLELVPSESAPISLPTRLRAEYCRGYQEGCAVVAFIPAHNSNDLLRMSKLTAYHDLTGFYKIFTENNPSKAFIDYTLDNIGAISGRIGGFGFGDLSSLLYGYATRNKTVYFQQRLLQYLVEFSKSNPFVLPTLKNTPFLLTTLGAVIAPHQLFFSDTQLASMPVSVKINFLEPTVFGDNKTFRAWLENLGVKKLTPIEFIRGYLLPMIGGQQLNESNIVSVTSFIKDHYDELNQNDLRSLQNLLVLNQGGQRIPAYIAYLSNVYHPAHPVEQDIVDTGRLVSPAYLADITDSSHVESWKQFWLKLRVSESISAHVISIDELWVKSLYQDKERMPRLKLGVIHHFYYVDFIHLLNTEGYGKIVWSAIGSALSSSGMEPSCVNTVQHFLTSNEVCKDDGGRFHVSSRLYSSRLAPLVRGVKPVANLPIALTEQAESYLGIQVRLSLADCLEILGFLSNSQVGGARHYGVFLQLLDLSRRTMDNADFCLKDTLQDRSILLPAENGALRPASALKFFNLKNVPIGHSSQWFKHYGDISVEDRLRLAALLGLAIVNHSDVQINAIPLTSSAADAEDPKEKLRKSLALIAYCSTDSSDEVAAKHQFLNEIIEPLQFVPASVITLEHGGVGLQTVSCYQKGDVIYYQYSISDIRTNREFCKLLGKLFALNKKAKAILPWVTCLPHEQLMQQLQVEHYDLDAIEETIANFAEQGAAALSSSGMLPPPINSFSPIKTSSQQLEPGSSEERQVLQHIGELKLDDTPMKVKRAGHKSFLASAELVKIADLVPTMDVIVVQDEGSPTEEGGTPPSSPLMAGSPVGSGMRQGTRRDNDPEKNKATGDWGEIIVYRWLENHYRAKLQNKYMGFEMTPNKFGFMLRREEPDGKVTELTICWNNKPYYKNQQDSGMPYDFSITKKSGDIVKKRIVEVKSTTSSSAADLYISGNELAMMVKYKAHCRLFRVYDVGSELPKLAIKKDPASVVRQNNPAIRKVVVKM